MENQEKLKLRRDISHYWPEIAYEDFVDNLPTQLRMCSFTHVFMDRVKSEDIFYRVRWGYLDKLGRVSETVGDRVFETMKEAGALVDTLSWIVTGSDKGLKFLAMDVSEDGKKTFKWPLLRVHQQPELLKI